jgi:hypothetical protein
MSVFWVVTQCGLAGRYQRFGETYCLLYAGVPLKRWHLPTSPHGTATQKTDIDNFTAVRTANPFFISFVIAFFSDHFLVIYVVILSVKDVGRWNRYSME